MMVFNHAFNMQIFHSYAIVVLEEHSGSFMQKVSALVRYFFMQPGQLLFGAFALVFRIAALDIF